MSITFKAHLKPALIILASVTLSACGGGGGGGGSSSSSSNNNNNDTASNNAPTFSSNSASISVSENSTGVIYTASATDADGDNITYSISGGDDQAQFTISASSAQLQFKSSPDYEDPQDSNKDNVYKAQIKASDGSASATMTLSVTVTNADEADTSAPTEPRLVSLASVDASSIDIDWIGSSDDHTGSELIEYQIHISTASGFTPDSSTLQSSVSNTISATIAELNASTEYFVVVLAIDEASNQSASEEKSVTTTSGSAVTANDAVVTIVADVITSVADDGNLTLEKTSATEALQANDIIVSDQDDGLLLKVESITDNDSELQVTTTQATLVDAFEQVEFNLLTTLEDIDTESETQGLLSTGQSARGLSSSTLSSDQNSQELLWPSGLRLQQEDFSYQTSTSLLQPNLSSSEAQAIDESGAGTLASAYEVYATSSDTVISFDFVLEIEDGYSFGDIEVNISHDNLSAPDYNLTEKSSTSSREEYRIQWNNSGITSSAPFEVDISVREQDCWQLCTLSVRTEVYVLGADKESLFDDEYSLEANNSDSSAQVLANSGIGFSPDFDVLVRVENSEIEYALTQISGELKLENTLQFLASASSDGNISQSETTLFSKEFTKTIMVDTVPIVISGNLDMSAELQGNIAAAVGMETLTESSITVSAGVEYQNGEFTYMGDAETTYKFEVTGATGATIAGELRLIPDISISFYRVTATEITLEPYIFSETTLEGDFKAMVDNEFVDTEADYRFSELSAGIAMNATIASKFGDILDASTISAEDTWNNDGNAILGPHNLVSLPSAQISDALSAASPTNGLLLGLETTSGSLGFDGNDNPVIDGYWQASPEDNTTFSASGDNVSFDYTADAKYELRYVFYSELGSFVRQYQSISVELNDSDDDGMNNHYEDFYGLNPEVDDADQDHDNDGYSNLEEYENGSDPISPFSYPGSDPDNLLPGDFAATAGDEQITLSWTSHSDSTVVYNIYRSTESNCNVANYTSCSAGLLFPSQTSPLIDSNLTNYTTTYYYWIEASQEGNEAQLAEDHISATPHPIINLNDTGIDWGGDYESGNNADCSSNFSAPQDCHQGRDNDTNNDSDGYAGFSLTKLDSAGNALEASAAEWSCVQDNVTGLIWEVKINNGLERDKDNTYQWGGYTAMGRDLFEGEDDDGYYDDWNALVDTAKVNQLCGFTDWRVPNIEELRSIVDYSHASLNIDANYFPNTSSSFYWSASPYASDETKAWALDFSGGEDNFGDRDTEYHVRLVHSGQ